MISFAQNFEDVLLARIFRDQPKGFYVDVGAHYPIIDSVTEHFYRLGWRGINIEPLPTAFSELTITRPFDVNLNVAVAESEGEAPFFALDGLSTLNGEVAARYGKTGLEPRQVLTTTRRLDSILSEHAPSQIDFLKIDVEGAEGGVVRSNDWSRFRPSILIIEAIDPQTQEIRTEDWQDIVLEAGYEMVHFDGANQWYCNKDFAKPISSWFVPPNSLDHFTTFPQISAEARATTATREAAYEREHLAKELTKISEAITALAEGHHSTPAPNDGLAEVWQLLQEIVKKSFEAMPDLNVPANSSEELVDSQQIINELRDEINVLKRENEDFRNRLVFSEKSRLNLVEVLSSRGVDF